MHVGIIVAVLSVYCFAQASARMPPWRPVCKSGVIGPDCETISDCKTNYTCVAGSCCREHMCPDDMVGGNSCNLNEGEKRCEDPFNCIDNFCCRNRACPKGTLKVGECQQYSFSKYGGRPRCRRGAICHDGLCCKSFPKPDLCPIVKRKPLHLCPQHFANPDECESHGGKCGLGRICCDDECGVKHCRPIFQLPFRG